MIALMQTSSSQTNFKLRHYPIASALAILLISGLVYHNSTKIEETEKNILDAVHDNKHAKANLYKNIEYLDLKQKTEEARADVEQERKNVEKYPDDDSFRTSLQRKQGKLAEYEKNLVDFERDVLKLAEEINKIPINSERGKKAKAYFEKGEYQAARDALDEKEMSDEKNALLKKRTTEKARRRK